MNATHFPTRGRPDGGTTGNFQRISEEAEALKPHGFTGMWVTGDGHTCSLPRLMMSSIDIVRAAASTRAASTSISDSTFSRKAFASCISANTSIPSPLITRP